MLRRKLPSSAQGRALCGPRGRLPPESEQCDGTDVVDAAAIGADRLWKKGARVNEVDCPICGCRTYRRIPALLDPFITLRCGLPASSPVFSNFCSSCEYMFKTPFLSASQLAGLYDGYRDGRYNEERIKIEPGYAETVRLLADRSSSYWSSRQDYYDQVLSEHRSLRGVVVDFGGGDGYFSKYVFPEAEVHVVEESYERDGGDLPKLLGRADFIFCAQVFEHLPDPLGVLSRLAKHVKRGALIWIDVPNDHAHSAKDSFARFEQSARDGTLGWTSTIVIYHEHVANFCPRTLRVLFKRAGLLTTETVITPESLGVLGYKD